jgi:hypothetical protein
MFRYANRNRPDQDKGPQRVFLIKFMVNILRNNKGLLYRLNINCVGKPHLRRSSDNVVTGVLAGVRFQAGKEIFILSTASKPALGSTQPHIQWFVEPLSLGVMRPGQEASQPFISYLVTN